MHIVMLCSNYPPHTGGLEIVVHNLAQRLGARHTVTVVTTAWEGKSGVSREGAVSVHRLPALHFTERYGVPYPLTLGPGIGEAMAAIRDADIVHAHGALYLTTVLGALMARPRVLPLILTEHVGFVSYRSRALEFVQRVAWTMLGDSVIRRADAVVALNPRVLAWLSRRYPGRMLVQVPHGVDPDEFHPRPRSHVPSLRMTFGLPPTEPLALFVGRAAEKKNLATLLEVDRERYHLVVCGAERRLRDPGLSDLGILPHHRMPSLLACVDLLVLPSTGEGLPVVVQEAFATGVPVVLLWDPGYDGVIPKDAVIACNSLEDIGPGIRCLLADDGLRAEIGRRARDWAVREWSWERTVNEYEVLYERLLSRREARMPRRVKGDQP